MTKKAPPSFNDAGSDLDGLSITTRSKNSTPSSTYGEHRPATFKRLLYAADWLAVVLAVATGQLILIPPPRAINFLVTDPSIQQHYENDHFNISRVATIVSTSVPTVLIILWMGWFRRPLNEIHQAILGLYMALSFTSLFTAIFKQISYTLSSDFLRFCNPSPENISLSVRTGIALPYQVCRNQRNLRQAMRIYPSISTAIPACGMTYLALFAGQHLGLYLHPQVCRQLQAMSAQGRLERSRPGQTLLSFFCLLLVACGMVFAAIEAKYHGGQNGWGVMAGLILGWFFSLWAHIIYCSDMRNDVFLPPYNRQRQNVQ